MLDNTQRNTCTHAHIHTYTYTHTHNTHTYSYTQETDRRQADTERQRHTHTHTQTHTQKERERARARETNLLCPGIPHPAWRAAPSELGELLIVVKIGTLHDMLLLLARRGALEVCVATLIFLDSHIDCI